MGSVSQKALLSYGYSPVKIAKERGGAFDTVSGNDRHGKQLRTVLDQAARHQRHQRNVP
jgi:hypothetical protein